MTLHMLGCQPCASLPAWTSAFTVVHLCAPAPRDVDPSVERTEAKLEALFSHSLLNTTL